MHKDHSARRATAYSCPARARRARLAPVFALVSGAALLLAACGGGGGGSGPQVSLTKFVEVPDYVDGILASDLPNATKKQMTVAYGDGAIQSQAGASQYASYGVSAVGAAAAHRAGYKGQNVTVAVVDTGVDVNHPDLEEAFDWSGVQNRKIGNPKGQNFVENPDDDQNNVRPRAQNNARISSENSQPTNMSHGTHVAGIIAARDNNGIGAVGIAPQATLLPIRWLSDGSRQEYKFSADADPDDPTFAEYVTALASVIDYASRNDAFVMNNSWGTVWRPRVVGITLLNGKKGYFLQPRVVQRGYAEFTTALVKERLEQAVANAAKRDKGMVFVFAAGNDGWNSETGEVEIFSQKFSGDDIHKYLNQDQRDDPVFMRASAPLIAETGTPADLPGPLSTAFIGKPELQGIWLTVVATDRYNKITPFSNGCGEAARYCLAAPGAFMHSTIYKEDGDFKSEAKHYGQFQGTSMAAPVVSGAAAVVKSRAPNLTARQVVEILLRTATDLGAPGTDPVYGRGLVNLARAVQSIGNTNTADRSGRAVAATGTTRIAFSAAFGNAASSTKHLFGGLDSYGRVYRYRAPLQDRMLPGPRLSGVLALNSPAQSHLIGRTRDTATYLRRSTDPESAIGDGSALSIIGSKTRIDLAVARRRTSSLLSPAALLAGEKGTATASHDWGVLAPQSRDLVSGGAAWQLSPRLTAGTYVSRALAEGATQRGESYGMTDLGLSARLGSAKSGFALHLGRLSEEGRFLGSKPEGGYALAGPTRSHYLRLSASHRVNNRLSVGLDMMRLRAKVDFRHDDFVADTDITARSAGVHLALSDAAMSGDRLVLHYGEPLAVTGGAIRQSSVMGYTAAGAYRSETRSLDLGVRARHRMAQVMYRAPLADGITGFAAAAHHRNWSHQRGRGNNLVMFGLTIRH